jgi:ABC-type multidrug transport system ATPase subunit/pSer/pThr/pTyr-binding forkhead associated (FHA) protein
MSTTGRWVIGRAPECDLVLPEAEVSSRHCCLTHTPQGWVLEDLGSSNGTFVNGTRLKANQRVRVGPTDDIKLGLQVPFPWGSVPGTPTASVPVKRGPATVKQPVTRTEGHEVIRVGRAPDNDIVFDQPSVSAHHARIQRQGDRIVIEDLGSSNGTAIGNPDNRVSKAPLRPDDVVYLGSLRVPAARLLGSAAADGRRAKAPVVLGRSEVLILGRAPDCDQVLDFPMISAHHARLSRQGDEFVLEDLNSTNGTFVNGSRITRVRISPGDTIELGSYRFTISADGNLDRRDLRGNTTLEARGLTVKAGGRVLIADVNLTIFPGEFVGLMGPSGAGKTTLMNALNGYTPPAGGSVLINGRDLYHHYNQFRSVLGYVPQEDVMHRDLTVGQALYFTARLRLPPDYSRQDIEDRIRTVLEQLSLQGTENVLIGSAEVKGISGGQRRRVNLAMELLTDPQILFLDEPTSGLSSEDALTVMKVLRGLADNGKTILLTIHQPSLEVYRLMDNLVLMGKDKGSSEPGQLVYFGPAYPDAVHHFNPDGLPNLKPGTEPLPDEVLRGLSTRPCEEWVEHFEDSKYHRRFVSERAGAQVEEDDRESTDREGGISSLLQWWILVRRLITIKLRDRMNTAILLVQAPIVAILIVMVFGKQIVEKPDDENWIKVSAALSTSLFLMSLAALWFGASNAVREIVGEWAIYHRERMVSLRIGPYVASKFAVLGLLALFQCLTLLIIVDVGFGLKAPRVSVLLMLMMAALVGTTVGLILSAMAKTNEVAIALLPIVLLPMVILGGAIQPVHNMHSAPRLISNVIPTRWGYEGLLLIESRERPRWTPPVPPTMPGMDPPKAEPERDMAESSFQKKEYRTSPTIALVVLSGMLVTGVASVVLILRRRDVH